MNAHVLPGTIKLYRQIDPATGEIFYFRTVNASEGEEGFAWPCDPDGTLWRSGIDPKTGVLRSLTPKVFEPLLSHARYLAAHGGRGSGKSHFFAERAVTYQADHPGARGVCIREVEKSLTDSSRLLIEDKIRTFGLQGWKLKEREIETPGGGIIIFRGMQHYNADSIKSLEAFDWAWVAEGQSFSERSLDLLRPTLRKPGSFMMFDWNPEKPTDAIEKFFRPTDPDTGEKLDPPPRSIVVEANWRDNPWFAEGELVEEKDYDLKRDPSKYAWVWMGRYLKKSEALVFSNWRVEDFDITPPDGRYYFGADWGYSVDPSVLVRCFIIGRTLYVDYEVYALGCDIDYTPALFAGDDPSPTKRWQNPRGYKGIPGALKWKITADSARPDTIAYMKRHGFTIEPAKKGQGSVEDGIEFLKGYDIVVHTRCRHTKDELATYSWKQDKKTKEIFSVLEDKDNHVIDSLRYAVESLRRGGRSMVFQLD